MSVEKQQWQLSVLLIAQDALDRDPMARLVPTEYQLTVVHTELEAAALAYAEAKPDVLLLAVNDLDASAAFRTDLLKKCEVSEQDAPMAVALCFNRHSAQAGELCMRGVFDDFATAKPTPHPERILLALRRAKAGKQMRLELVELRQRLTSAQSHFEALTALEQDLNHALSKLRSQAPEAAGTDGALGTIGASLARLAKQGRSACLGSAKKVLIVDDDEMMREILGAALEAGGYEACFAETATQAVEMLEADRVALILMDLMMPGLDGLAATRKIRTLPNYRSVPIIVVSGHGDRDSVRSSRSVGANDFLVKPIDQDRLLEKVRRYVQ